MDTLDFLGAWEFGYGGLDRSWHRGVDNTILAVFRLAMG